MLLTIVFAEFSVVQKKQLIHDLFRPVKTTITCLAHIGHETLNRILVIYF